jgi:hypothetical protein
MSHLLARVMFKKNPKAALKSLDRTIEEARGYEFIRFSFVKY